MFIELAQAFALGLHPRLVKLGEEVACIEMAGMLQPLTLFGRVGSVRSLLKGVLKSGDIGLDQFGVQSHSSAIRLQHGSHGDAGRLQLLP